MNLVQSYSNFIERLQKTNKESHSKIERHGSAEQDNQVGPVSRPVQTMRGAQIGWKDTGTEKGRGVFALADIPAGAVLEVSPVIPVAANAIPDDGGAPDGYLLDWDPEEKGQEHCMALGYVMLLNHSENANVSLESDLEEMTVTVSALRNIRAGEEILWDYACDIWFDEG